MKQIVWGGVSQKKVLIVGGIFYVEKKLSFELFFTSGRKEIIDMLRQRSRPYLFSNSLAPSIVGAATKVIELLSDSTDLRDVLEENTQYFREKMTSAGFDIKEGVHPIVPVMLYDAKLSQEMSNQLL